MNYAKCRQCGSKNPEPTEATREHFLFCSMTCKETKETDRLKRFEKEYETHNPWDRFSEDEKEVTRRLVKTKGAVKWDPELFKAVEEETTVGKPRTRADGKVDGRSKGVRKCGKCGEHGHNARTCGRRKGPASLPQALQKPVGELPRSNEPSKAELAPSEPQKAQESPKQIPPPRSMAARDQARSAVRQSKKGGRKCGKCGEAGHNARTCGRPGGEKPTGGKTGRKNKCGKCGGLGHNARSCQG